MSCASVYRLAITEFPQVRRLAFALATHDGAAELDHALDLLLIGLTATMSAPDGHLRRSERAAHSYPFQKLLLGRSEPEFGQVVSASWTRRPCIAACVARDGSRPNHAGRQHLRTQFMDNRHYP